MGGRTAEAGSRTHTRAETGESWLAEELSADQLQNSEAQKSSSTFGVELWSLRADMHRPRGSSGLKIDEELAADAPVRVCSPIRIIPMS